MGPRSSMDRHPSAGHVQLRTNEILSILRSYQGRIKGDDDDVPSNDVLVTQLLSQRVPESNAASSEAGAGLDSSEQLTLERTWQEWDWGQAAQAAEQAQQNAQEVQEPEQQPGCFTLWRRQAWSSVKAAASMVRSQPSALCTPLLLLALCLGLGLYGLWAGAQRYKDEQQATARSLAHQLCMEIDLVLKSGVMPTRALAGVINVTYSDPVAVDQAFVAYAPQIRELAVQEEGKNNTCILLSLSPHGIVKWVYDPLKLSQVDSRGLDLLQTPVYREWVMQALTAGTYKMDGPWSLGAAFGQGIPVRMPIYVHNVSEDEDFGFKGLAAHNCGPFCYNATTRTKLWGIAISWLSFTAIRQTTQFEEHLIAEGYRFALTRPGSPLAPTEPAVFTILNSTRLPREPVTGRVEQPDPAWTLSIEPEGGWMPKWYEPLIALVCLMSVAASLLLLAMVVSRRQHLALLHAMMPPKAVGQLQRGETVVDSFKTVTILFSDIVSYTTMASEMPPQAIVKMLNEIYSLYDTLCEKYELYKVETIGDAFMCVGGCPTAEDPVASAVRVARMAQAMVNYTRVLVTAEGHSVRIRVGMHSGPITAAVVGLKMPRYALFGDTVNTASRMESNSAPMSIHISSATADLLRASGEDFGLTPRGGVDIKGKGWMETFWLGTASPDIPRTLQEVAEEEHEADVAGRDPAPHKLPLPALPASVAASAGVSSSAATTPATSMAQGGPRAGGSEHGSIASAAAAAAVAAAAAAGPAWHAAHDTPASPGFMVRRAGPGPASLAADSEVTPDMDLDHTGGPSTGVSGSGAPHSPQAGGGVGGGGGGGLALPGLPISVASYFLDPAASVGSLASSGKGSAATAPGSAATSQPLPLLAKGGAGAGSGLPHNIKGKSSPAFPRSWGAPGAQVQVGSPPGGFGCDRPFPRSLGSEISSSDVMITQRVRARASSTSIASGGGGTGGDPVTTGVAQHGGGVGAGVPGQGMSGANSTKLKVTLREALDAIHDAPAMGKGGASGDKSNRRQNRVASVPAQQVAMSGGSQSVAVAASGGSVLMGDRSRGKRSTTSVDPGEREKGAGLHGPGNQGALASQP